MKDHMIKKTKTCPICEAVVRVDRLEKHLLKIHKSKICVCCDNPVNFKKYDAHLETCSPGLAEIRKRVLASGGKVIGRSGLKQNEWIGCNKKAPDGDGTERTEYDEIKKDYRTMSGGAFGLGKRNGRAHV